MTHITTLPNELLIEIAKYCSDEGSAVCALARTSKQFCAIAASVLREMGPAQSCDRDVFIRYFLSVLKNAKSAAECRGITLQGLWDTFTATDAQILAIRDNAAEYEIARVTDLPTLKTQHLHRTSAALPVTSLVFTALMHFKKLQSLQCHPGWLESGELDTNQLARLRRLKLWLPSLRHQQDFSFRSLDLLPNLREVECHGCVFTNIMPPVAPRMKLDSLKLIECRFYGCYVDHVLNCIRGLKCLEITDSTGITFLREPLGYFQGDLCKLLSKHSATLTTLIIKIMGWLTPGSDYLDHSGSASRLYSRFYPEHIPLPNLAFLEIQHMQIESRALRCVLTDAALTKENEFATSNLRKLVAPSCAINFGFYITRPIKSQSGARREPQDDTKDEILRFYRHVNIRPPLDEEQVNELVARCKMNGEALTVEGYHEVLEFGGRQ